MQVNKLENLPFYWATRFVRTLYKQGIKNVVISPGSRSTPLTLAFACHPGFSKTIAIDERSAAFVALGQSKAFGKPSVLVCTSGTAVANYFPAINEAHSSGVPLIIASADRPAVSREVGASQTMDQLNIFGNKTVFFYDTGEPSTIEENLNRVETAAIQSVYYSTKKAGVAHINFPFNKPLEPEVDFLNRIEEENKSLANIFDKDLFNEVSESVLSDSIWQLLLEAKKPIIVVGPLNHFENSRYIIPLAKKLNAPILAEPGSNLEPTEYQIKGYAGFLRPNDNIQSLEPDLIIRMGASPVTKAAQSFLNTHKKVTQIRFTHPRLWQDGDVPADFYIPAPQKIRISDITGNAKSTWLDAWKKAEKNYQKSKIALFENTDTLTDGFIFHQLGAKLPKDGYVMLSNSFPVRDLALFSSIEGKEIYVNRGVAGIDGIISTTIGIGTQLNTTGTLFIGDIAFLHDSNALLSHRYINKPLVIVVLNNNGGNIFRMLPIYELKEKHLDYFETPQQASIKHLCKGYAVPHHLVTNTDQLSQLYEQLITVPGVHVIECKTDADYSMQERQTLWQFSILGEDEA